MTSTLPLPIGEDFVFDKNARLGKGAYGDVCSGVMSKSGQQVAVKCSTQRDSLIEIDALKLFTDMKAPHIVKILGAKIHHTQGNAQKEYVYALEKATGSLDDLLKERQNIYGLDQNSMIDLINDCCSATESLCQLEYAHRDLKPANILVFSGPKPSPANKRRSPYLFKFCDVGGAKKHDGMMMDTVKGTVHFLHPKLAETVAKPNHKWKVDDKYTALQCDLWALGCTIFKAASAQMPFPLDNAAVYYDAVKNVLNTVYEMAISAEKSNDGSEGYQYKSNLPDSNCSKWFEHCVASLIRMMLHQPEIALFREIANALCNSKEFTFFSLTNMCTVKYCDLSRNVALSNDFPKLLPQIVYQEYSGKIALISSKNTNVISWSSTDINLSQICCDDVYVVQPDATQIMLPSKSWLTAPLPDRFDANEVMNYIHRRRSIAVGVKAIRDCEDLISITVGTVTILKNFIEELFKTISSVLKDVEMNCRMNMYSGSQCQALALLTSGDNRKLGMEGNVNSESRENELSSYLDQLNKTENNLRSHILPKLKQVQLDDVDELAGVEEELSWYMEETREMRQHEQNRNARIRTLVQQCLNRRLHLADQMRTKTEESATEPVVHVFLRLIHELLVKQSDVKSIECKVSECATLVQMPLQEIKKRVETLMAEQNVNPSDLHRLRLNLSQYAKLSDSSREIRDLVSRLGNLMPDGQDKKV